ncbi:lysis protein [Erwinia sp. E602]|nr:lysis protein [Erwinia sp. E602]QUG75986.1 lysis protein [Erwinia sp. E602]
MTARAWVIIAIELLLSALVVYVLLGQVSAEKQRADDAELLATQRQQTIDDMQVRQRDVAALDAKYTGELADAKAKLDDLQQCVRSGKCGLRVNASCSKSSATTAGSVGDATSPRLTDSAERDYFTLRERISTITGQVSYLQQYIREQCLK